MNKKKLKLTINYTKKLQTKKIKNKTIKYYA